MVLFLLSKMVIINETMLVSGRALSSRSIGLNPGARGRGISTVT